MHTVFAAANIVCLPSYREGLPKALLEAAAAGRAIVTTDVPGCREVIEPGVGGHLVPWGRSVELADALETLIVDSGLRARMGAANRRLAESDYGIERIVAETLEVYGRLVSGR
jgi:glycosyltransferase involved in cell wall biosynthesis